MSKPQIFPFEWRCASCRFEQWVRVKSLEVNPDLMGGRRADLSTEVMYAQQASWRVAKMKLALRPCPKCGAIDKKTVALVAARPMVAWSLTTAVATFLLLAALRWPPYGAWAFAFSPMMGVAMTGFHWMWSWQPREGDVVADA